MNTIHRGHAGKGAAGWMTAKESIDLYDHLLIFTLGRPASLRYINGERLFIDLHYLECHEPCYCLWVAPGKTCGTGAKKT